MSNHYPPFGYFSGTGVNLTVGAAPAAASKTGILYMVLKRAEFTASTNQFVAQLRAGGFNVFDVNFNAADDLLIEGRDLFTTIVLSFRTATARTDRERLVVLAAWNLATGTTQLYVNDVDDKDPTATATNTNIEWTAGSPTWTVGSNFADTEPHKGLVSEFWFTSKETLDISSAANRAKFYDTALQTLDLGADGSGPTGTQPDIYMRGAGIVDGTNVGDMGNFTANGSPGVLGYANQRPDWMAAS